MAHFEGLSNEILEVIFLDTEITIADLVRLTATCQRFRHFINDSNKLWMNKFSQRWPELCHVENGKQTHWKEVVCRKMSANKAVKTALTIISAKYYLVGEPSISHWNRLVKKANYWSYLYTEQEFLRIIFQQDQTNNLTHKFYAIKGLRYIRYWKLERDWKRQRCLHASQQSFLKAAVFFIHWSQINAPKWVTVEEVEAEIYSIACRAAQLAQQYKADILIHNPKLPDWWLIDLRNPIDVMNVLVAVNRVIYDEIILMGSRDAYLINNIFIDRVLKHKVGIPITLCIIYHEVAKRLGINLDLVGFGWYYLLRWKKSDENQFFGGDPDRYIYVDAFNRGQFLTRMLCLGLIDRGLILRSHESIPASDPKKVIMWMTRHFIDWAITRVTNGRWTKADQLQQLQFYRLHALVNPHNYTLFKYGDLADSLGVEVEEVILKMKYYSTHLPASNRAGAYCIFQNCKSKLNEMRDKCKRLPNRRRRPATSSAATGALFAVGMIMYHRVLSYRCVIIDWDIACESSAQRNGVEQPFYKVLIENDSNDYVPEEILQRVEEPLMIPHADVGRYFDRFDGERYLANRQKSMEYPDDDKYFRRCYGCPQQNV